MLFNTIFKNFIADFTYKTIHKFRVTVIVFFINEYFYSARMD